VSNDFKVWPAEWPLYKQHCFSSFVDACDMLVGPCACGAWHRPGEFEFLGGRVLMRNGEQVDVGDLKFRAKSPAAKEPNRE